MINVHGGIVKINLEWCITMSLKPIENDQKGQIKDVFYEDILGGALRPYNILARESFTTRAL